MSEQTTDPAEPLRQNWLHGTYILPVSAQKAALDEIERLRARLARTRDLLVRLHDGCPALTSEALNLLGAEIDAIDAEAPANGR